MFYLMPEDANSFFNVFAPVEMAANIAASVPKCVFIRFNAGASQSAGGDLNL